MIGSASGEVGEPAREDVLEQRTQMRAACYNNPSAYLGDCPHQSGAYTICYVALIYNIGE